LLSSARDDEKKNKEIRKKWISAQGKIFIWLIVLVFGGGGGI